MEVNLAGGDLSSSVDVEALVLLIQEPHRVVSRLSQVRESSQKYRGRCVCWVTLGEAT